MVSTSKLPSGFRRQKNARRKQNEGIATSDNHSGKLLNAWTGLSLVSSLLLAFLMNSGVHAFAPDVSAPAAIAPAEQAYAAYQNGDFETARSLWYKAAKEGDTSAQYNLGLIYSEGRGVVRNPEAAISWWRLAAENGHPQAQHNLALAYISGETIVPGVSKEPRLDAAFVWFRKAARQGLASSRFMLGSMLLERASSDAMRKEAIGFLTAAADQDHAEAQFELGKCFSHGEGVEVDRREALALFLEAGRAGYAPAQDHLAELYQSGEFVPADKVEALAWASLASDQGLVSAVERREALLLQSSTSEIAVAEIRAAELSAR